MAGVLGSRSTVRRRGEFGEEGQPLSGGEQHGVVYGETVQVGEPPAEPPAEPPTEPLRA